MCKPREDSSSLTDLLCEAKNVVYEARDDSTGISFVKNGKREWVPVVVTEGGREMSVAELAKKISISNTHCKTNPFPTNYIAKDYK